MAILPCSDKKTYFCIRTVGGATFGTSMFAGIFNPEAFTYTNYTGTLVWAHFRFGWRSWSGKSYFRKPKFILEGWKYIWTMCGNGIGKVIAHRRNNEAARCPKAYEFLRYLNGSVASRMFKGLDRNSPCIMHRLIEHHLMGRFLDHEKEKCSLYDYPCFFEWRRSVTGE